MAGFTSRSLNPRMIFGLILFASFFLILGTSTPTQAGRPPLNPVNNADIGLHGDNLDVTLPDLVITDIWSLPENDDQLCYQVQNAGEAESPSGHTSALSIYNQLVDTDVVSVKLKPGERRSQCFDTGWSCYDTSGDVKVCADANGQFTEKSEQNNCLVETWKCDTHKPAISDGPYISDVTSNTVTISWVTDEESTTTVEYDHKAGGFGSKLSSDKMTTNHVMIIPNLEPATLYQFRVQSVDAQGNLVSSKPGFFETLPLADSYLPTIFDLNVSQIDSDWTWYTLDVPVTDNQGVARVDFSLDGIHLDTVYSEQEPNSDLYQVDLIPGMLGLSHDQFFTSHTISVMSYDLSGKVNVRDFNFTPTVDPMDGDLELVEPGPEDILYIPGTLVPVGKEILLKAFAAQYEEICQKSDSRDFFYQDPDLDIPISCQQVPHAVKEMEFQVRPPGGVFQPLCVITPTLDKTRYYNCYWNASGKSLGVYTLRVIATATDNSVKSTQQNFEIRQGTPDLEMERTVTRSNNTFTVQLTIRNQGTIQADIDEIFDPLQGFQVIQQTDTPNYSILPRISYSAGRVYLIADIDLFRPGGTSYPLNPGGEIVVEYQVIPVLFIELDPSVYAFGGTPLNLYYSINGTPQTKTFHLPVMATTSGEQIGQAVMGVRRAADYLIITNPSAISAISGYREDGRLLGAVAELAKLKNGILGYILRSDTNSVKTAITRWGSEMSGTDGFPNHFRYNGYLLIVGEAEVIGAYSIDVSGHAASLFFLDMINYSDFPYTDWDGDGMRPNLVAGRIIGDNATELKIPIQTSIDVEKGLPSAVFDRSSALIISGSGEGVNSFEDNLNNVQAILQREFSSVLAYKHSYWGAGLKAQIKAHDGNQDVFFYRDHCNGTDWSGALVTDDFSGTNPVDFENSRPFSFACCCEAGRYEDVGNGGIAESFMQAGSAVYIGSTEISDRGTNNDAAGWFFDNWVTHTNRTIGQSLFNTKYQLDGYYGKTWITEYNQYGDPKFGNTAQMDASEADEIQWGEQLPEGPQATVEINIPYYTREVLDGYDRIEIPGGNQYNENGAPLVPSYQVAFQLSSGEWVNEVVITARSMAEIIDNLFLKTVTPEPDCSRGVRLSLDLPAAPVYETWPEVDFEWKVESRPDGANYLVLDIYPLIYHPGRMEGEWTNTYTFSISTTNSNVALDLVAPQLPQIFPGSPVPVDYWLSNSGLAQDAIVTTLIRSQTSGEVVEGLPIKRLNGLHQSANFTLTWNSGANPPGVYIIEAELQDLNGNPLDRKTTQIQVGIIEAEAANLQASTVKFVPGNLVTLSFQVSNTGTGPIDGTAYIQVQNMTGGSPVIFTQPFLNLAAGASLPVQVTWDTTGLPLTNYSVSAYATYNSQPTEMLQTTLQAGERLFIPMIRR